MLLLRGGIYLANGQPAYKQLAIADCAKMLRADSVHLFFDATYALVPPECAAVRRESRMDTAGNFTGEVRDYQLPVNRLASRITFRESRYNGLYEQYHPNKQRALSGQFTDGLASGIWQFWYANGQPQQTLEWTGQDQPRLRIIAYWDSTGQQQVTNGTGSWWGTTSGIQPVRFGGRVADGLQEGTWESRSLRSYDVVTIEKFRNGRLLSGQQFVGGQRSLNQALKYSTNPSLVPQIDSPTLHAEPFHFGRSCEEQAAQAAQRASLGALKVLPPQPPQGSRAYQLELMKQLPAATTSSWTNHPGRIEISIIADVDEHGKLSHFTSEADDATPTIGALMSALGVWQPATVNGIPVPGKLHLKLELTGAHILSNLYTTAAYPLPPKVFKKIVK